MTRKTLWGSLLVVLVLLAGCGHSSVSTNPEFKKEIKQVEPIVKGCATKSKTKKQLVSCLAPKGHEKQFEGCAISALKHDFVHHARLIGDLSACVVKWR